MSAGELTQYVKWSLQRKYDYPEWMLSFEVPGKNGRRADAIAYCLYHSQNFKTVGFEIKASRGDWKREMDDVSKADYFVGQCDEWYVVAAHAGVVKEDELPEGWGLKVMKAGGKLYTPVESSLTAHQDRPTDREFFVRGIKKAIKQKKDRVSELQREKREARREGREEGKKLAQEADMDDYEIRRKFRYAEKWRALTDGTDLHRMEEDEYIEQVNRALRIIKEIREGGPILGYDLSAERIRKRAEGVLEGVDELEEDLDELKEMVVEPDGDA